MDRDASRADAFPPMIGPESKRPIALPGSGNTAHRELPSKGEQDQYLRAVIYLISQVARCLPACDISQTSKFHFLAFKAGVAPLLDRLAATRPGASHTRSERRF